MKPAKIFQTLRENGLCVTESERITKMLNKHENLRLQQTSARNWDRLLAPLSADIKNKSSSMARWRREPNWDIKGPVFETYLALLHKTKERIQQARTLNQAGDDLTIPELAELRELPNSGMHWSDWVPRKAHATMKELIDKLYTNPDIGKRGKRLVPFKTDLEQTASDKRWDALITFMNKDILAREGNTRTGRYNGDAPLIDAMHEALDLAYTRDAKREAPVNWTHLLSPERRAELDAWYKTSIDGMRDPDTLSAATQALYDAAEARNLARRVKRNAGKHHS